MMSTLSTETTVGFYSAHDGRTVDVGAGVQEGLLVVADGLGGHCTGWLGVLLSVRPICGRFANPETKTKFVGAADDFQDDWGWAGAMQSKKAAEYVFNECHADFGDISALPRDLEKLFVEIDRVIHNVPNHERIHGLLASCIAVTIEGTHVRGVHSGIGLALLLRAGTEQFENLVVAHYLHLVQSRLAKSIDMPAGIELPRNVIMSSLGCLTHSGVGVDSFDVVLGPGDVLLILSRLTNITKEALAGIVRKFVDANVSIDELARAIERHAEETVLAPGDYTGREFAFGIVWARAER